MSKYSTDVISGKVDVVKKTEVYPDASEKYLSKVVLYAKDTSDGFLYVDSEKTVAVTRADLLNLCMNGLVLVSYKGTYYAPIFFKDNTTDVAVTIATAISAGASAALELKSKELAEE